MIAQASMPIHMPVCGKDGAYLWIKGHGTALYQFIAL